MLGKAIFVWMRMRYFNLLYLLQRGGSVQAFYDSNYKAPRTSTFVSHELD